MEQTLSSFVVTIMTYQDQWVEMGSTPGPSNLIFLKSPTGEYRYVAMKDKNNEVILNDYLSAETQYVESSENFHCTYLKNGTLCGINFGSVADAKKCSSTVYSCIEHLKGKMTPSIPEADVRAMRPQKPKPPPVPTTHMPRSNSPSVVKPSVRKISKPQINAPIGTSNNASPISHKEKHPETPNTGAPPGTIAPPASSSGGAPPPPPAGGPPPPPPAAGPPAPPAIKKAAAPAAAPTAAPAPKGGNDLLSQLQAAANKPRKPITEPSPSSDQQNSNSAPSGPKSGGGGGGGGGGDFMSEMRSRLGKKNSASPSGIVKPDQPTPAKKFDVPVKNNSPRRSSIRGIDSPSASRGVTQDDLEKLRQQIMSDVTAQMNQLKTDIIEGICSRLKN